MKKGTGAASWLPTPDSTKRAGGWLASAAAGATGAAGSDAIRAMSVAGKRIPQSDSSVDTAQAAAFTGATSPKPAVVSVEKLNHTKSTHRSGRAFSTPPTRV